MSTEDGRKNLREVSLPDQSIGKGWEEVTAGEMLIRLAARESGK